VDKQPRYPPISAASCRTAACAVGTGVPGQHYGRIASRDAAGTQPVDLIVDMPISGGGQRGQVDSSSGLPASFLIRS
jgi:hypothetical protein